jgi:hypothetical protein
MDSALEPTVGVSAVAATAVGLIRFVEVATLDHGQHSWSLANKAGVRRTTVYSCFPNRDAVLAAYFERANAVVLHAAEPRGPPLNGLSSSWSTRVWWLRTPHVASRRLPTPPPRTLAGVARDNEYGEIEYGGLPVLYCRPSLISASAKAASGRYPGRGSRQA